MCCSSVNPPRYYVDCITDVRLIWVVIWSLFLQKYASSDRKLLNVRCCETALYRDFLECAIKCDKRKGQFKSSNRSQHILCSNPLIMRVRAILYLSKKCRLALVCTLSANHAILMLFFGNFVPIGKTSATASIALACADWNVCRYICKVVVGVECPKQL